MRLMPAGNIPHPKTLPCAWLFGCPRMAHGYDHDHDTDVVRNPLCSFHNRILEEFKDNGGNDYEQWSWIARGWRMAERRQLGIHNDDVEETT